MTSPRPRHPVTRFAHAALAAALVLAPLAPAAAQQPSRGSVFLTAVKEKEGGKVIDMLGAPDAGEIVNARDISSGETALHVVTQRRDRTWMSYLLGKGADPNRADRNGVTPLAIASNLGFVEGVELLVKKGAQVNDRNNAGETPLIAAVHKRDLAMMRILLKAGANPDRTDNSGRSARDYALLDGEKSLTMAEIERSAAERGNAAEAAAYGPVL